MKIESIASTTHIDEHNTRMSKKALESAAEQINGDSCAAMGLGHDISLPPLGKTLEASVKPMDDGEHQLIIIQEIFEKESRLEFADGSVLIKREGESDKRPFINTMKSTDQVQIAFDPVNFTSKSDLDEFIKGIEDDVGKGFIAEHQLIRKAAIPDPELVFTISQAIIVYLLGKKIIDKLGDKVISQVADDLANFYALVKTASYQMVKYAVPKNRPITYVFDAPGTPNVQLVAITHDPNLLDTALEENRLKTIFAKAENYHSSLKAVEVQYILNTDGEWEFNYLLTNDGAVIGTEASFNRQARMFDLLLTQAQRSISPDEDLDKEHKEELLATHKRRLHKLKNKQALFGHSVDPQVLIEIEDLEDKIKGLEN